MESSNSAATCDDRLGGDAGAADNDSILRLSQLARQLKNDWPLFPASDLHIDLFDNPLSPNKAWSHFGALLGIIPPAAIFLKLLNYGYSIEWRSSTVGFVALVLASNIVCAFTGHRLASRLSRLVNGFERRSWSLMLLVMPLVGAYWGIVTGFTGGLLLFGVGAIVGVLFAVPIGILAFTLFAVLHRLLATNEIIERKYFLPVSYGICSSIAAFILGF